jgi:hypothetical protein
VTPAVPRPIGRVPRQQDLVVADADPHLLHVEIHLLEVGTSHRRGFLVDT